MTDANADREGDLSERQFAVSEGKRATRGAQQIRTVRHRGRLTEEQAAARRNEAPAPGKLEVVTTVAEVPPEPVEPRDPEAALRHARIGVVTVAVLVLLLVWIMQRKRGA